jgi:uncharacterized protein YaeQ
MMKSINLDNVRDLMRNSSKERRHDVARHVKENKETLMTRTASVVNFKKAHLE